MIKKSFKDIELSTLGMGNMRLPQVDSKDPKSPIYYAEAHKIIDLGYESGINYFDTAYVYNGGDSERCLGECMKKHDRDSFYIATKWHYDANPDYKAVFEEQLERLQTDHIDFYLFHCLMNANIDKYLESGAIEYFEEQRRKGRITYLGFSSHADPEVLDRFSSAHNWDFAQIQLNYYDWLYGTAKKEYEILHSKNIPMVIMEPVRGGRLASLTPDAEKLLKEAHSDWTTASWALKFVKSLPGIQVVLSGMSTLDQMKDNINTFCTEEFTEADREVLFKAAELFKSQVQVPCTACRYCTDGCPKQINIPEYLKFFNAYKIEGKWGLNGIDKVESVGKPADCIKCKKCMGHCPQSIEIPKHLEELASVM